MKKVFFAVATAAVALLGFTGCSETVSKDVAISFDTTGKEQTSGSETDNGLTMWALQSIYLTAMQEMEGAVPLGDNSVYIKSQTSEKQVKDAVLAVGKKADQAVKAQYGDPVMVSQSWSNLSITLYYNWTSEATAAVTYAYE